MYGSAALTTGDLVGQLEDPGAIQLREIDRVAVKGRSTPIALCEILACEPPDVREQKWRSLGVFAAAMSQYKAGQFAAAGAAFGEIVREFPEDGAAALLRDRCHALEVHPPSGVWDGIWHWDRK